MTDLSAARSPASVRQRFPALDAARGVAIVAMVVYHTVWDLGFLRIIAEPVALDPPWQAFARTIAASFLLLVGVSLVLAHGGGFSMPAFSRRLAFVGGAAVLVTAATYALFPDSYVFFGILHAIALGSILALPFLRLPTILIAAAAALVFAMPLLVSGVDHPAFAFLGLRSTPPRTNDYVPLFPWFGFILTGIVAARLGSRLPGADRAREWRAGDRLTKGLVWAGRRSLPIYLIHQPLLLALLYPLSLIATPAIEREALRFTEAFEESCRLAGGAAEACEAAAVCTEDRLKSEGMWRDAVLNRLTVDGRARALTLARECMTGPPAGEITRPRE
jgi:uncharacterized membrane protein